MRLVELRGVSRRFGTTKALDGFDLSVEAGRVFALLGPNGAGKTTTVRLLLGLVQADAGTVSVFGVDPIVEGTAVRNEIGVVLADDGLYDRLTVWANLDFHGRLRQLAAVERGRRIEDALRSLGIWDRRDERVGALSTGLRRRVAFARAILHRPRLLLLDEPFTGLDPIVAGEVREQILHLSRAAGVSVILTTHDLHHAERVCDEVAVMSGGRLLAQGPPGTLGGGGQEDEVEIRGQALSAPLLENLRSSGVITSFRFAGSAARVLCSAEARRRLAVELAALGVVVEEMFLVRRSLEDTYVELVGGKRL